MKRLSVIIILLLIFACIAYASSVDRRVRALVDDLAKKYLLTQETLVSKKTVTLVEVKNISPLAEKNYVGQAVAERIKTAIQDSLVFVNDGVGFQRRLYENNFLGFGLKADVGAEYFVLPRFSVNAGLAYHLVFITNLLEVDATCPTTGDYYYSDTFRAIDAFGLNPFELPDGTPLACDLFSANYLKLYIGATFYF